MNVMPPPASSISSWFKWATTSPKEYFGTFRDFSARFTDICKKSNFKSTHRPASKRRSQRWLCDAAQLVILAWPAIDGRYGSDAHPSGLKPRGFSPDLSVPTAQEMNQMMRFDRAGMRGEVKARRG